MGWQEHQEVQEEEAQSPGEEQPQAPVYAGGKLESSFVEKDLRFLCEPVMCPVSKEGKWYLWLH